MTFHINMAMLPKRIAQILLFVVLCLTSADIFTHYLLFVHGHDSLMGFQRQFDLRSENNIPTWYSSMALGLASFLLFATAKLKQNQGDRYAQHWLGLGAVFLFLSLDEAASLHELASEPIHRVFHTTGYFYYGWIIPAGLLAAAVGLCYLGFLIALPASTRLLFIISGAVFVGGAVGLEMLEGVEIARSGYDSLQYAVMVAVEETMEMLGVVLFIYALTSYVAQFYPRIELSLHSDSSSTTLTNPNIKQPFARASTVDQVDTIQGKEMAAPRFT